MEKRFKIKTEIDGQTVKADCRVALGRFLYLTMTAPYNGIKTELCAFDDDGNIRQFYDCKEAEEYACKELEVIMGYIRHVNQYRSEYGEASAYYKHHYSQRISEFRASEVSKQRGCLVRQSEITNKVLKEYQEILCRLIPNVNTQNIVHPNLLAQILILT